MIKKASLNLSIQTIVIVVIAMVLLGLGVGFVKTIFDDIGGITGEVSGEVREQVLGNLRTSGAKFYVSNEQKFTTKSEKVIAVGVQNNIAETIYFALNISFDESQSDHKASDYKILYSKDLCENRLTPSEPVVIPINIRAPNTPGTDTVKVSVILAKVDPETGKCTGEPQEEPYTTKTTFFKVK